MRRIGLALWVLLMLIALSVVAHRLVSGLRLETNILALLPQGENGAAWQEEARAAMQKRATGHIVVVLTHARPDIAVEAARELAQTLTGAGLVMSGPRDAVEWSDLATSYYPYRSGLLSDQTRALLRAGDARSVEAMALARIHAPFGLADAAQLQDDPYLLFADYVAGLSDGSRDMARIDGFNVLTQPEQVNVIVDLALAGNSFSSRFQTRFLHRFDQLSEGLVARYPGLSIKQTGAVFYAARAMQEARSEASTIGVVSILAIIAVTFAVFRGVQPIGLALLAIGAGLVAGMAAVLLLFDGLHLMALVFGAALVGVSVDYAFHYCCQRFAPGAPHARARAIAPALSLGVASSVIGFLTMTIAPFDGLRQIAVFSSVGLGMSFLTVMFVLPRLDRSRQRPLPRAVELLAHRLTRFWQAPRVIWGLPVVLLVLLAGGLGSLRVSDDVRQLQNLPADLRAQERDIAQLTGVDRSAQFFLIAQDSTERALIAEEELRDALDQLVGQDVLAGYTALSRLVPSVARQIENRALVAQHLSGDRLLAYRDGLGIGAAGEDTRSAGFLTPDRLPQGLRQAVTGLSQRTADGKTVHVIALRSVRDPAALAALAKGAVHFIDPAAEISTVLSTYRVRTLLLLAVAFGLVWVILGLRYGPRRSFLLVAVPAIAVLATPAVLAFLGEPFTFFNAMGLLLVFALGLDYALFCAQGDTQHVPISLLANCLSALSTILAFGLLALSQQYAVHAFGQTILVGVLVAFGLAPISRHSIRRLSHDATPAKP